MAERIQIPIPTGDLLPAEERLENALKAIEGRTKQEINEAHRMEYYSKDDSLEYAQLRSFIQGLDIAWSLAKTEAVRRTDSPT